MPIWLTYYSVVNKQKCCMSQAPNKQTYFFGLILLDIGINIYAAV